jgi:hypothetical protein
MLCIPLPVRIWKRALGLVLSAALAPALVLASESSPGPGRVDSDNKEAAPFRSTIHPFFREMPWTAKCPWMFLTLTGPEGAFPRNLLVGLDGTLVWLAGTDPSLFTFARAGQTRCHPIPDETRLFALTQTPQDWIWLFGERDYGLMTASTLTRLNLAGTDNSPGEADPFHGPSAVVRFWHASPVAAIPEEILPLADGGAILSMPGRSLKFEAAQTGNQEDPLAASFVSQDVPSPAKGVLATAGGGWRWTVTPGMQAQAEPLGGNAPRTFELPFPAHAAAADPEGNLWFTEGPRGTRIGRLTPDGKTTLVDIGADTHPMEIVHGADQAYFTVHNAHRIGALWRARVVPEALPRRRSLEELGFAFEAYQPRPERAPKTRQCSHARSGSAPVPPSAVAARPGAEADSKRSYAEALRAPAKAAAAPAPRTPEARLARLGVTFPRNAEIHILKGHGAKAPSGRSRFEPAFHSRASLQALVARGLEEAGTLGMVVNREGNFETLCQRAGGVGFLGDGTATDYFLVVTRSANGELVTAFPERRDR